MPTSTTTGSDATRRGLPRWLVVVGAVGTALGMLAGFRHRRLDAATRTLHDRHGPPPSPAG